MPWFVYKVRNGQPWPQRFEEWPHNDGTPLVVDQKHQINQMEFRMRISKLMDKYPYKPLKDLT